MLLAREETIQQRVFDAFADGSHTVAEIATNTGLAITQVKQAVHTMKSQGILECPHSAPSYQLTPNAVRPTDRRGRKPA